MLDTMGILRIVPKTLKGYEEKNVKI
jgi:hypothetical protein